MSALLFEINATRFKKILLAIKDMAQDVSFEFSNKGIFLQCMDSGHIALANLVVYANACTRYQCNNSLVIGIHLDSLLKVLNMIPGADTVIVEKKTDDSDKLEITLESDDKSVSFELSLMDIDAEALDIPTSQYDVEMMLPSTDFANSLKSLLSFSDNISLQIDRAKPRQMNLIINSSEGEGVIKIKNIPSIIVRDSFKGLFSLKYLAMFTKGKDLCENTTLKLQNGAPLVMEYQIKDDNDQDQIILSFFLAPKITD